MNTDIYLFAGNVALWLIPTTYLFLLTRRLSDLERRLKGRDPPG